MVIMVNTDGNVSTADRRKSIVRKVTIRDVARAAGVGVGTVSRVLNNSPQVSDSTRERVMQIVDAMGFKPHAIARQLPRKTRFKNIGVITRPFIANYYSFAERLRGVQNILNTHEDQYELVLFNTRSTQNYDERLLTIIQTAAIEGLIIIDLSLSEIQQDALYSANIPFIGLNHLQDATWPCIWSDNVAGGYKATRHLLELGHRLIAYVGDYFNADGFLTSGERYTGYRNALAEYRLKPDPDYVLQGEHGYDSALWLMRQLLERSPHPTAVFAMSDVQALGCITAIREAGLRVPEDISVIGYDDLESSYFHGLTTVRQHLEISGELGMEYLLEVINGRTPSGLPELPPLQLMIRETTCRLQK